MLQGSPVHRHRMSANRINCNASSADSIHQSVAQFGIIYDALRNGKCMGAVTPRNGALSNIHSNHNATWRLSVFRCCKWGVGSRRQPLDSTSVVSRAYLLFWEMRHAMTRDACTYDTIGCYAIRYNTANTPWYKIMHHTSWHNSHVRYPCDLVLMLRVVNLLSPPRPA